jgi:phospholipid/cholesterol/gamma-HCH transport system permease protein
MMGSAPLLTAEFESGQLKLSAAGSWTAANAGELEALVDGVAREAPKARSMSIDMAHVRGFDTFGAWLLERLTRLVSLEGGQAEIVGLPAHDRKLLDEMHGVNRDAVAHAGDHGLSPVFETARMYTGAIRPLRLERVFGVTTFELG